MAHPGDQRFRVILVIRRAADARQLTPESFLFVDSVTVLILRVSAELR